MKCLERALRIFLASQIRIVDQINDERAEQSRPKLITLLYRVVFLAIVHRIGHTTGDRGRALPTYIGEFQVLVKSIVDQTLSIAGVAVVPIGMESIVLTSLDTREAVDACLLEAEFLGRGGCRVQGQIGYETSEAPGATLFRDQQVVDAESPDSSHICNVPVRPIAH
jgi:hypothetical protein